MSPTPLVYRYPFTPSFQLMLLAVSLNRGGVEIVQAALRAGNLEPMFPYILLAYVNGCNRNRSYSQSLNAQLDELGYTIEGTTLEIPCKHCRGTGAEYDWVASPNGGNDKWLPVPGQKCNDCGGEGFETENFNSLRLPDGRLVDIAEMLNIRI